MKHFLGIVISLLLLSSTHVVHAAPSATLYLSPQAGSYAIGENISVNVLVSSPDQEINAVSGVLSFPVDLLELVNIQKNGSIVSLWVQEPAFDNFAGSIQFEGAIFNPIFKGKGGAILKLTFRVKASGTSVIKFVSSSVLANDGLGTNVLNDPSGAKFQLLKPSSVVAPVLKPQTVKSIEKQPQETSVACFPVDPNIPVVYSMTHPDSKVWYADNNPEFKWVIPSTVTAIAFSISKDPYSDPGTASKDRLAPYTYRGLENGQWYFHIRFKTNVWQTTVVHFPFNIDVEKPAGEISVLEVTKERVLLGGWVFRFIARDSFSGIDQYEISVDDGEREIQRGDGEHTYRVRGIFFGTHTLSIKAVDRAGNSSIHTVKFGAPGDIYILSLLCIFLFGFIAHIFVAIKRPKSADMAASINNIK